VANEPPFETPLILPAANKKQLDGVPALVATIGFSFTLLDSYSEARNMFHAIQITYIDIR
jgi:hypothetical protein